MPPRILEGEQWQQRTIIFRPGDLCLLYTGGVAEAQNAGGDFFDVQRLATSCVKARDAWLRTSGAPCWQN